MKILWVSPRWPVPADSGAKQATLNLLQELIPSAQRMNIDLNLNVIFLHEEDLQLETKKEFEHLTQTQDNLYLQKSPLLLNSNALTYIVERVLNSEWPYTVSRCQSSQNKKRVQAWSEQRQWDYTIIDGSHAGALVDFTDPRYGRIVYRAHNVETDLWKQLLGKDQGFLKNQAIKLEHRLCHRFEGHLCEKSEFILPVSELDATRFRELHPHKKIISLPIGISFVGKPLPFPAEQNILQLLFVGRLDWLPNKEGLQWFLNEVWPEVATSMSAQLSIIGSGESTWLQSYASDKVQVLGRVDDLIPYYQNCHITLVPLFMGSGTRVKAIEAGSYGRSFISTSLGVEGLPFAYGADYIRAENKEEWIQALRSLTFAETAHRASRVFAAAEANFDQKILADQFFKIISKLS